MRTSDLILQYICFLRRGEGGICSGVQRPMRLLSWWGRSGAGGAVVHKFCFALKICQGRGGLLTRDKPPYTSNTDQHYVASQRWRLSPYKSVFPILCWENIGQQMSLFVTHLLLCMGRSWESPDISIFHLNGDIVWGAWLMKWWRLRRISVKHYSDHPALTTAASGKYKQIITLVTSHWGEENSLHPHTCDIFFYQDKVYVWWLNLIPSIQSNLNEQLTNPSLHLRMYCSPFYSLSDYN